MNKILFVIVLFVVGSLVNDVMAQQAEISLLNDHYDNVQVSTHDILQFQIVSAEQDPFNAYVEITVSDANSKTMAIMESGIQVINLGAVHSEIFLFQNPLKTTFSSIGFEDVVRRNFIFPFGQYNVCVSLKTEENGLIDRKCLTIDSRNAVEILLIYPFNDESINESNPSFTWTPVFLPGQSIKYQIKWIEKEKDNSALVNFFNEIPFFTASVKNNIFPYSNAEPPFDRSKSYYWQVQAYSGSTLIAESEVWKFHFEESKKLLMDGLFTYINLEKANNKHIHYIRQDGDFARLGIKVDNYNNSEPLEYKIYNANESIVVPTQEFLGDFEHGTNYLLSTQLNTSDSGQANYLEPGKLYICEINRKNQSYKFRFIVKGTM